MRKNIRKALLLLGIIICFVPLNVNAEKSQGEIEREKTAVPADLPILIEEEQIEVGSKIRSGASIQSILESSYNTNKTLYNNSVKNQGNYGVCWAFAANNISESYCLKNAVTPVNDFSELHLSYFTFHRPNDPLSMTNGDTLSVISGSGNFASIGSNSEITTLALSNWLGPVSESAFPYSQMSSVVSNGIDSSYAYSNSVAHMQDAYWISMKDPVSVKESIKMYGSAAVTIGYNDSYMNYQTDSFNNNASSSSNHMISIIGWDDNYSRDNFTAKPVGNGAWLCKNSWGSYWGDNGYFYVSYEDKSILESNACFYQYESASNYDKNYMYDGGLLACYEEYTGTNSCGIGNVFTSTEEERLEAVSFVTFQVPIQYEIRVYKNVGNGVLAITQTGQEQYAGYHTIELDTPIPLTQGEKFSVVIKLSSISGGIKVPVDAAYQGWGLSFDTAQDAGQSYISVGEDLVDWNDLASYGETARIKAFTKKGAINTNVEVSKPDNLIASVTDNKVLLSWSEVSGVSGYYVYTYQNGIYQKIGTVTDNSFVHSNLKPGTTYQYSVKSFVLTNDSVVESDYSDNYITKTTSTLALKTPSIVTIKATDYKTILIQFSPVANATNYQVYEKVGNSTNYNLIKTSTMTSITLGSKQPGTTYYYKIRAVGISGDQTIYSAFSQVVSVKPKISAPVLGMKKISSTKVKLNWKKIKGAVSYNIYRSTKKNSGFKKIKTVKTSYFTDIRSKNKKYYYKVRAYYNKTVASDYSRAIQK